MSPPLSNLREKPEAWQILLGREGTPRRIGNYSLSCLREGTNQPATH